MKKPVASGSPRHLRAADLLATAQLATAATVGVTRVVEGVHQSVWRTLGAPGGTNAGQTRGLTGLVYRSIGGATRLVGHGLQLALARLQPLLESGAADAPGTPQREAVLAALNGVMGDHLADHNNAFATRIALYTFEGQALDLQRPLKLKRPRARLVLLIHGLCMNDLQWHTSYDGEPADHGQTLCAALDASALYLRYNTGRHVSTNGRALADLLEQLYKSWPTPLQELIVVAHSMGGLLIRSAVHIARARALHWPNVLESIVFLGTPHHGAPLERAGNWIDLLLGSTPWSAPFTRLTQLRSAGITDLRYGFATDADWQGKERFRRAPDRRSVLPLPAGVACYAVAATTASKRSLLADRLLGDGLVPLHSALGQHAEPLHTLAFAKTAQWIGYRMNHMQLLGHPDVTRQILHWLN
ncbi:MAG: GPI inositol-deacylase [Rhodoferax sp.]|nr:GPI inositol-deacylase [Rhodoferax sp.]